MKNIHMICNAHLDPVWLWPIEEGCTEALSTFRTAAELIDEFPGFVFNHNEALLYEWVKQHDPSLFERIRTLIREGKWRIIGGWYLQPDCNMPSGESLVRNMLAGRKFFAEAFGASPRTAINFDSFGHTRGLVQPLVQAGYDSYLVCRPAKGHYPFASQDFTWVGLDGSSVVVHRSDENYNSVFGQVADELRSFAKEKADEPVTLFLWGVGDHGGGPSRIDLANLAALAQEPGAKFKMLHSNPEAYFAERAAHAEALPVVAEGLNPVAPGCYTSQIRVKQLHRMLENELYATERMCTHAFVQKGRAYPKKALAEAQRDLLLGEFHDALPGSGSQRVEEDTIRLLHHALEIVSREKLGALIALSEGEASVEPESSTVMVYNPHPFAIEDALSFECGLPKQNWDSTFMVPQATLHGEAVPTQSEMEISHFCIDWRKRVTVYAKLAPFSVSRFVVKFHPIEKRPTFAPISGEAAYVFDNGEMRVVINTGTGLIDSYQVNGKEYLKPGSFELVARDDTYNSWGIGAKDKHSAYRFRLLTPHEGSAFSGLGDSVAASVRVIEDGEVRTVVEVLFGMHDSKAYQRYMLPKRGTAFDVELGVYWNEKDMHLKLEVPTTLKGGEYLGQIPFGEEVLRQGEEVVSQQWVSLRAEGRELAVLNQGSYGSSCEDGRIGLTLLRSAGHSASDGHHEKTLHEVRHTVRMEQGERLFRYRIAAGEADTLHPALPRMGAAINESPYAVAYNPPGRGEVCAPFMTMDAQNVALSALKPAEDGNGHILRLYEAQGLVTTAHLQIPTLSIDEVVSFKPFEIRTWRIADGKMDDCGLLEGY